SLDVGRYAYISNDNTNEFAIFGAATAGGGGNRVQLSASTLNVGTDINNPLVKVSAGTTQSALVGIGSSTPGANLSIAGTSAGARVPLFLISTSTASATTTAIAIDQ